MNEYFSRIRRAITLEAAMFTFVGIVLFGVLGGLAQGSFYQAELPDQLLLAERGVTASSIAERLTTYRQNLSTHDLDTAALRAHARDVDELILLAYQLAELPDDSVEKDHGMTVLRAQIGGLPNAGNMLAGKWCGVAGIGTLLLVLTMVGGCIHSSLRRNWVSD